MLLSFGVQDTNIKKSAITGWVVDIQGKGEPREEGISVIALRADMDALPMPENNPTLPYLS